MRTTLTLDEDVAAQLDRLRARGDRPFKELVNETLRAGLVALESASQPRGGPYTRPADLGRALLPDLDDISESLAVLEGDDHR